MPPISNTRLTDLRHHYDEGLTWLAASNNGAHTTLLAHAAFELRLAIERLAVHYIMTIQDGSTNARDREAFHSFKNMERRIYDLAGHQRQIDRSVEVIQIMLDLLQIPLRLSAPNVGQLSRHWHRLSELCHIYWNLTVVHAPTQELDADFHAVADAADFLNRAVSELSCWPSIPDPAFAALTKSYIEDHATAEDIRAYCRHAGLWGQVVEANGRREFVGTPLPRQSRS